MYKWKNSFALNLWKGATASAHKKLFRQKPALKWYPRDLIGWTRHHTTIAANQNEGGKCIWSPHVYHIIGPRKGTIWRGQFVIWPRVLIIITYFYYTFRVDIRVIKPWRKTPSLKWYAMISLHGKMVQ